MTNDHVIQPRDLRIFLEVNGKPLANYTLIAVREESHSGVWAVHVGVGGNSYGEVESPYGSPFETLAARALRLIVTNKETMTSIEETQITKEGKPA